MSELGEREIDPTFSLARYADYHDYYSEITQKRILTGPLDTRQQTLHQKLQTEGISVLPLETDEANAYYTVPEGAQPLDSLGIAIGRGINRYGAILRKSGKLARMLMEVGWEMDLRTSSFAEQTAISFIDQGRAAVDLLLTPPYELQESNRPPEEVIEEITKSLTVSFDTPEQAGLIRQEIEGGFYEIG